jgi:hypothetical protein
VRCCFSLILAQIFPDAIDDHHHHHRHLFDFSGGFFKSKGA